MPRQLFVEAVAGCGSVWVCHGCDLWRRRQGMATDGLARQKIAQKSTGGGWRIGESVAHAKFGEGVIVNIEGGGGNARAQINFGQHGMKVLDLGIAKLERLGR